MKIGLNLVFLTNFMQIKKKNGQVDNLDENLGLI